MDAADSDHDLVSRNAMLNGDRGSEFCVARRGGIAEAQLADLGGVGMEQLGQAKVRADAFREVMARRAIGQGHNVVSNEPRHRCLPFGPDLAGWT